MFTCFNALAMRSYLKRSAFRRDLGEGESVIDSVSALLLRKPSLLAQTLRAHTNRPSPVSPISNTLSREPSTNLEDPDAGGYTFPHSNGSILCQAADVSPYGSLRQIELQWQSHIEVFWLSLKYPVLDPHPCSLPPHCLELK